MTIEITKDPKMQLVSLINIESYMEGFLNSTISYEETINELDDSNSFSPFPYNKNVYIMEFDYETPDFINAMTDCQELTLKNYYMLIFGEIYGTNVQNVVAQNNLKKKTDLVKVSLDWFDAKYNFNTIDYMQIWFYLSKIFYVENKHQMYRKEINDN